ncbi:MAG TPA: class I SAM-dependent methyltransferase [Myxococcota bacterium]|jgi:SAM-dependent methyltransferase|nr:class I SAM-dependent methyltransferase [Myxococcota bacterium]
MSEGEIKRAIRDWWAAHPMTYGEEHGEASYRDAEGRIVRVERGSRRFFELADERFYAWNEPHHEPGGRPFGRLFDYDRYKGARVLEVGCGMGCMAMNWAREGALVTAVDLNPVAVAETRRRFATFGLAAEVREADGEALPFEDGRFAFAFSWGVLHHSPQPRRSIAELHRVLAPGGRVGVMLYHRRSLLYRVWVRWQEGFVNLEDRFLPELDLASRYADGARAEGNPHTWPVTQAECRRDLFAPFEDVRVEVFGTDVPNVLDTLAPGLGARLPARLLEALARRFGWSLWITGRKAANAEG